MELYPLVMEPYFRHGGETPWGGSMLRDAFGKSAPDLTGESLEISALPGMESIVRNGPHAGKTLPAMIALWGERLTGANFEKFPLLLKLLDVEDRLSVQVHPDDAYAASEGRLGKTEAWIILNCDPGVKIVYGLEPLCEPLETILEKGELESVLHTQVVRPGDVYYIPHGMVHSIGGGVQIYEIQQSSDATYRFWDWNRVDAYGRSRELHTRQGLDVTRPDLHLDKIPGTTILRKGGSQTYYIADENFELSRLNVSGEMPLSSGRMLFLTPTCPILLRYPGGEIEPAPFDSVLLPAELQGASIVGEGKVLMSTVSDRAALRAELGYRAPDVAGLVD